MGTLASAASVLFVATAVVSSACDVQVNNPPPATASAPPPAPPPPVTTVVMDAGAAPAPAPLPVAVAEGTPPAAEAKATPATPAAGDYFSCKADADCVAVPKNGCCHNGYHEAVNKQSVDAYKASFTCEKKRPICPQFMIKETKVARCDTAASKCVMAQP
jgi:hypothetical protein